MLSFLHIIENTLRTTFKKWTRKSGQAHCFEELRALSSLVSQSHSKQSARTHDRATLPNAKSREGHGPNRSSGSAGAALQSSPETPGPQPALLRAPQAAGANPTQPQRTSRSPAGQELQLDSDTPSYEEVAAT